MFQTWQRLYKMIFNGICFLSISEADLWTKIWQWFLKNSSGTVSDLTLHRAVKQEILCAWIWYKENSSIAFAWLYTLQHPLEKNYEAEKFLHPEENYYPLLLPSQRIVLSRRELHWLISKDWVSQIWFLSRCLLITHNPPPPPKPEVIK